MEVVNLGSSSIEGALGQFYDSTSDGVKYRALVLGDFHISDKPSKRHKDYWGNCLAFLEQVTVSLVERKITHLFLTSDLIGRTNEKNFKERENLLYFIQVLQKWNDLTNGNVYALEGNHDVGSHLTDYQFIVSLGILKRAEQVDVGGIRFHLLDFGRHDRAIELREGFHNVAIMHTHLQVEGQTDWFFRSGDAVELSDLHNLKGVDMVIGGHIHDPSPRIVSTSIDDKPISLFYPGCGPRPIFKANDYHQCFGVFYETDEDNNVDLDQVIYELDPHIWAKVIDTEEDLDLLESEPEMNIQRLAEILDELKTYSLMGDHGYRDHIVQIGGIDKEGVDLALQYVDRAEAKLK